jgi:hypothetical protein
VQNSLDLGIFGPGNLKILIKTTKLNLSHTDAILALFGGNLIYFLYFNRKMK